MKNYFFLFFFTIFTFSLQAQDIDNLDKKMGFNKFKLEENFSKYQTDCKKIKEEKDKTYVYEYTKNDVLMVFEQVIKKILLTFYNGNLLKIEITIIPASDYTETFVLQKLTALFGEPQKQYPKSDLSNFLYAWISKKVILYFSQLLNVDKTETFTSISLVSSDLLNKKNNDQF